MELLETKNIKKILLISSIFGVAVIVLILMCTLSSDDSDMPQVAQPQCDAIPKAPETVQAIVYAAAFDGYLNIRDIPSSSGNVLGTFRNGPGGAVFIEHSGNWTKIRYKDLEGYVLTKYLSDTPTKAVTVSVDADWLKGIWNSVVGDYAYLLFDNGTYSVQSEYGTAAYGSYILEGDDILFYASEVLDELGGEISHFQRYKISGHIETMTRMPFVEECDLEWCEELVWTQEQYDDLREETRIKINNR